MRCVRILVRLLAGLVVAVLRGRALGMPMLVHALSLLVNQRLLEDIDRFSHEAELIVLPPPCPNNVAPSDFSQAERLIEAGYRLAAEALDDPDPAGSVTPRAIERLRPHQHG